MNISQAFNLIIKIKLVFIIAASLITVSAAEHKIYDQKTLNKVYKPYSENISYNYKHVIEDKLHRDERPQLRGLKLSFPLRGENNQFFDFYSHSADRNVVIPIESVKFLDDVCQAAAWLEYKKMTGQALFDYITLLKYRPNDFPGGKPMPPLQALGLPLDPTLEYYVDDVSQKCLIMDSSTRDWTRSVSTSRL